MKDKYLILVTCSTNPPCRFIERDDLESAKELIKQLNILKYVPDNEIESLKLVKVTEEL